MYRSLDMPERGHLLLAECSDEAEGDTHDLLIGLHDILTSVSVGAPAIAEALRRLAARFPRAPADIAASASSAAPSGSATTPAPGRRRAPELVINSETAEWMRRSIPSRVRLIELGSPTPDPPSRAATREPPQPAPHAPPPSALPYYSLDHLPPLTSERAFRRHLKAGLPVTRIGYGEVVTPAAWLAWLGAQAKPRMSAARAALPPAPSDDELLATVGAKPRSKR